MVTFVHGSSCEEVFKEVFQKLEHEFESLYFQEEKKKKKKKKKEVFLHSLHPCEIGP